MIIIQLWFNIKLHCSYFLKTFPTSCVLAFYLHLSQIYWSSTLPQTIKVFDNIFPISYFLAFLRWYVYVKYIYIYIKENKVDEISAAKVTHSLCSVTFFQHILNIRNPNLYLQISKAWDSQNDTRIFPVKRILGKLVLLSSFSLFLSLSLSFSFKKEIYNFIQAI